MSNSPAYGGNAPVAEVPGRTLGIVALIAAFFISLLGLILGIIAMNQSKAAGYPNGPAKAAIIVSIVFLVLSVIGVILAFAVFGLAYNASVTQ
jgi:hypothetical protein